MFPAVIELAAIACASLATLFEFQHRSYLFVSEFRPLLDQLLIMSPHFIYQFRFGIQFQRILASSLELKHPQFLCESRQTESQLKSFVAYRQSNRKFAQVLKSFEQKISAFG